MGTARTTVSIEVEGYRIDEAQIERLADAILSALDMAHCELSISFVSEDVIRQINCDYRGKDSSTDVLSFPQHEWDPPACVGQGPAAKTQIADGPPLVLGDVIISPANAQRNARDINQPLDREISFLLIHGILHLCGHDHQDPADEALMREQQRLLVDMLSPSTTAQPLWENCVQHEVTA